ncbi:MAG: hypothetical protein WED33_01865 [Bacteroidia bacterium]
MSDKEKYSVDDFWPGAEELLDKHFQKQSFWQRISPFAKGAGLLIVLISAIVFYTLKDDLGLENKDLVNNSNGLVTKTQDAGKEENLGVKNELVESEIQHTGLINEEVINQKNEIGNEVLNRENKNKDVGNEKKSGANDVQNEQIKVEVASKEAAKSKGVALNREGIIKDALGIKTDDKAENAGAERVGIASKGKEFTGKVSPIENSAEALSNSESKSVGDQANDILQNSKGNVIEASTMKNETASAKNKNQNSSDEISNSLKVNENNSFKARATQIDFLNPLYLNSQLAESTEEITIESTVEPITPIKNRRKNVIQYELSTSVFYVDKKLSSSTYSDYVNRRNSEESAAFFMSYGFGVKYRINNFTINSGLELNQYGEKVDYNPYLKGDVLSITPYDFYSNDTVTTPFYSYVQGNQFQNFSTDYVTDTLVAFDTTTVEGQVNANSSGFNSKTMLSYVEIPLSITYEFPLTGRLTAGINSGVSIGLMRERRGFYLDPELDEFVDLRDVQTFNSMVFNMRFGLDLNYYLRPGLGLFARTEYRGSLQSIFEKSSGINQRYSSYGLTFGVSKIF